MHPRPKDMFLCNGEIIKEIRRSFREGIGYTVLAGAKASCVYVSGGIMGKIIVITFAFMAFAFYELSGGGDFVPIADEKRAALEVERAEEARLLAEAKAEQIKANEAVQAEPVAQVMLASAVVSDAQSSVQNDEVIAAVAQALEAEKVEALTAVEPVVVAEAVAETPVADIREVTAARVNMRNGPGQNFNVVAKLNSGEKVEILQDPGDGWVKLRVAENGRVGWMADFLLTASNN